jgi:serine/threonine protein kinase
MMVGGYPPFQGDGGKNMAVLFRKIRAGDFTFHETLWGNVSVQCKRLISKLLCVNPDRRFSAKQALDSQWIQELDGRCLSKRDLSQSLKSLKKFNGRLSLKGAMHAVKFAISANFWNPDAVTFSRQTNQIQITDQVINAALRSPSRISFSDEYELLRKIRKGSSATVWECEHKDTKEIFAVKIINRPELNANDDEFVLNEVAIMQSLSQFSKYIVQLLDFFEEEDNFFLVMDYMGGGDVFDRILEKTKYNENDARMLTVVLLKAVRCIHSVGIAHRDLKPQNLLLTVSRNAAVVFLPVSESHSQCPLPLDLQSTENNAHIKITDFGFSRRVHAPQSLTSRCGTVRSHRQFFHIH